jgi:two-component system cell cycle response regulator DivK
MNAKTTAMSPFAYRPRPAITEPSPDAPLVLVADDHEDSRFIARLMLETSGFRVVEARTGTEALAVARMHRPSAIVLDIVMPELTGWEVARTLRADADGCNPAIIAVTALSGPADFELTLASGCDEMLVKPVHPRALIQVVRRYLAARTEIGTAG